MKHRILIIRTESAEMEVEAESPRAAREEAKRLIDSMECWADFDDQHLTTEWEQSGGIIVESLS